MAYSRYNRTRFEGEKPVTEGKTYDLEIESTGTKGDGIGKIQGFVVIVPGAKEGQKVKVKIDAVRGKVAFGTLVGDADSAPAADSEEIEDASDEETEETDEEESEEETEAVEEEAEEDSEEETEEEPAEKEAEEKKKAEPAVEETEEEPVEDEDSEDEDSEDEDE